MISKIIQKEKEQQKYFLDWANGCKEGIGSYWVGHQSEKSKRSEVGLETAKKYIHQHKQSLINLKEYMEEELIFIEQLWKLLIDELPRKVELQVKILQKEEDITEITKMIERYDEKEN